MERNLGFFEAWRAKRREKKNEELERLSAVKVEGGVLSKYLKLRSQEVEEGLNGIGGRSGGSSVERADRRDSKAPVVEPVKDNLCVGSTLEGIKTFKSSREGVSKSIVSSTPESQKKSVATSASESITKSSVISVSDNVSKSCVTQNVKTVDKTIALASESVEKTSLVSTPEKSNNSAAAQNIDKISATLTSDINRSCNNSTSGTIKKMCVSESTKNNSVTANTEIGTATVASVSNSCEKKIATSSSGSTTKTSVTTSLGSAAKSSVASILQTTEKGSSVTLTNESVRKMSVTSATKNTEKTSENVRKNSVAATPSGSRRSSVDCSSRRGSVASILSLSSIQDRILTLSQEQNDTEKTKKVPKVNKLSEDAFKIGKFSVKEESTKTPVTTSNSNVTSKITKLGGNSSGEKPADESKKIVKKKTTAASLKPVKDPTAAADSSDKREATEKEGKLEEKEKLNENTLPETKKAEKITQVKDEPPEKVMKEKTKTKETSENGPEEITTKTTPAVVKEKDSEGNVKDKISDSTKKPETEPSKTEIQKKPSKKITEAKKIISRVVGNELKKPESSENLSDVASDSKSINQSNNSKPPESLRDEVIQEAVKVRESMTLLTDRANQLGGEISDRSEASCISQGSDSSLRKNPKKLQKKLKSKTGPDECYPKTQKLLTSKPVNAFEQAKLDLSKMESVVSPSKVEAFLRDTLSPPSITGKEPTKTVEAVVEEILTSTSDKSRHEKPSSVRYTSRGEVICGVVSIKPSSKEEEDGLSAITLVPAFRPETSILDKERTSDYFSESSENPRKIEPLGEIPEAPRLSPPPEDPEKPSRDCFSPISDFSDDSYDHYVASVDYSFDSSFSRPRSYRSSSTPRRIFPQLVLPSPYRVDRTKEESPVVFDAGLSFDIASHRTSLRHRFKPQPAFTDVKTTSSSLSLRISDFLKRTDHIMQEWKHLGKGGEDLQDLVQVPSRNRSSSRSATNIMIRGLLNYSKGSRTPSLRSRSLAKTSEASDRTIADIDELSEMTLDLSEERATGTMQAERLEAETAERVRLEQELAQVQSEKKNLQQTSERLEMELFYARADVNGLSESEADLEDGGGDAALYKNKCERAMRELEFTRRRLQQQHEDDLEQLVALKKQLEKKLADAYEEVEEQRQVAAQWKRKVQKLQSEMNDLRLLLEEQSSRNNLLEKKQRKFDSEIQLLQEELRSERNQKERASREREMAVAEKYSLEQNLSSVRLELELKEEKVSALSRELEELSRGGGSEQEVTQLRKAKHDLDMKMKEQEEELDELAGQVSMLEANKLRLEMSLESLRKEHRREMAQRDDELDEVKANGQKKIKVLESQLESEHEERTLLVREKHELERRLADAEERGRHHRAADEDALQRARRDLKKTKALLRDAQIMLERVKQDSPSKAALRALKNQLEDVELARASAVKAKQSLEAELNEVTGQLEEALRAKGDSENRCQSAVREMNSLRTQVDENEEELAELLKKYRQTVQQLSAEQLANQETAGALAEAEAERASLRDQLAELTARLEANAVVDPMSGLAQKKLEIRIKELESRLELEQTTRGRLEVQITRLKENVERMNEECMQARTKEQGATDLTRKLQRSLREAKEELAAHQAKEQEAAHKKKELEKRLEAAEAEASTARTDLRLAVKRIEDLQSAISGEIGSDSERTESEEEDSENDSLVSHVPSTISSTSRTSRTPELTPR